MSAVADAPAPDLIDLRRTLHAIPEIGLHLPRTQAVVLDALAGLDIEITRGRALSSVVGVVRGSAPSPDPRPVVLLRADMDALPVHEEVAAPWISTHDGVMHACGHDLHTAALVGAAHQLCARRDELAGDVILMFQPGEEGPGGAAPMVEEGLLEAAGRPVDAAYAVHVFSAEHPLGVWFGRPGSLMAASDELTVTVVGDGGHGAAPHRTLDPVPVACEIVLALQTLVTRKFSIFDPVVVTVGRITAGTKNNIIGDRAVIDMTVRTFAPATREKALAVIERAARGICAAHGLGVEIERHTGYPATINDPDEQAFAEATIRDLFGAQRWVDQPFPEAGAEDMSVVMELVPGAYVNISACPLGVDPATAPDNHSPRAEFDDSVVPDMALFLTEIALRRCAALAHERSGGGQA